MANSGSVECGETHIRRPVWGGVETVEREFFLLGGGYSACVSLFLVCAICICFDGSYKDYVKEGAAQEGAYWVDDARTYGPGLSVGGKCTQS